MNTTAFSNKNKSLSLPLLVFSITMFLFLLNKVHSLKDSFFVSFPYFEADQEDLKFMGMTNTNATTKFLQLSTKEATVPASGQATHRASFHLWESPSAVASFESNFTFSISSPPKNPNTPAEGFTFFISSLNISNFSSSHDSVGGLLGLFHSGASPLSEKIVAIEFDTFSNPQLGDPNYRHIGIDINDPRSVKVAKWEWQNGKVAYARIKYNSTSKTLTAATHYHNSNEMVTLSYKVGLSKILPKYVQVGFSASTGDNSTQLTNIHSWSFGANLEF